MTINWNAVATVARQNLDPRLGALLVLCGALAGVIAFRRAHRLNPQRHFYPEEPALYAGFGNALIQAVLGLGKVLLWHAPILAVYHLCFIAQGALFALAAWGAASLCEARYLRTAIRRQRGNLEALYRQMLPPARLAPHRTVRPRAYEGQS